VDADPQRDRRHGADDEHTAPHVGPAPHLARCHSMPSMLMTLGRRAMRSSVQKMAVL